MSWLNETSQRNKQIKQKEKLRNWDHLNRCSWVSIHENYQQNLWHRKTLAETSPHWEQVSELLCQRPDSTKGRTLPWYIPSDCKSGTYTLWSFFMKRGTIVFNKKYFQFLDMQFLSLCCWGKLEPIPAAIVLTGCPGCPHPGQVANLSQGQHRETAKHSHSHFHI